MQLLHKHSPLLIPLLALCLAGCHTPDGGQEGGSVQDSSSFYVDSIFRVFDRDTARAYALLDSAAEAGIICSFDADYTRSRLNLINNASPIRARLLLERMLRQDDLTDHQRLMVLEQLVYVARLRTDDLGLLQYGMQLVDLCRQEGDDVRMLAVQAQMGSALIRLGRTDEGLAKVDDAIDRLKYGHQFDEMDACIKAMKSKITALDEMDRHDEMIPLAKGIVAKIDDFAHHPDAYSVRSTRFTTESRRQEYIDFYRGQAYSIIAYAHASTNRMDSARRYLALFEQTGYSQTLNGKMLASSTWCSLGMFDRMLAFYDELQAQWGTDTLHHDYAVMLQNRAIAASHQGHPTQSLELMHRYSDLMKQLVDIERRAQAQDFAARYHEQEQQLAFDHEQARLRNTRHTVAGVATLLVVALGFIIWLMQQQSAIRRKNKILVEQISEVVRIRNQALTPADSPSALLPPAPATAPATAPPSAVKTGSAASPTTSQPSAATPVRAKDPSALADRELFDFLADAIRRERLYTDPNFGRQTLVDRFHVSERRIGAAFSMAGSLPDYVRELRLAHACSLLAERPDMSIGEVGAAAGFSSLTVFGREFKRRYDVTPTYYRQQTIGK